MPQQDYKILSWNGTTVDGAAGVYMRAFFRAASPGPGTDPGEYQEIEAEITGIGSRDVRAQPKGKTWEIYIVVSSTDESSVATMYSTFNPENGLVYLRITDGDGAIWRVQARALSSPKRVPNVLRLFYVPIRVANPIWEQDSATTVSHLNVAANSIAIAPTNAGSRKARPVITHTPDLVKTNDVNDYKWSFRGFLVNKAPNAWNNLPVWLFDDTGVAARLATDTAASGAVVRRTTSATTLTADPGAAGTTIAVTNAAAFDAAGGMAVIRWVTGATFGTMEEISYAGVSGLNLTGCVRGLGGTTAQTHPIGAAIAASGVLPNGDDCRVWMNDVEIDRWLVAWNSTASDVVCNLTAPPVVKKTLAGAMTAASVSVDFIEGALDLPVPGFMAFENEIVYYTKKTALGIQGLVRGVHSTTAATHAVSKLAYGNPLLYTVAVGKATADAPPSPASKRPACQLIESNNGLWRWGDQADDASTVYYDPANPGRTAQWVPGFDKDGNDISPLLQLSASGNILTFKDDAPGDGSPPYNYVEQSFPMSVRQGLTSAIVNDWTPSSEVLNLELFVRDASGTLKLVDQLQQAAAAAGRILPASLSGTGNYGVKLKARYNILTGFRAAVAPNVLSFGGASDNEGALGWLAFPFIIEKNQPVRGVAIYAAKVTSGTVNVFGYVRPDSGNAPDLTLSSRTLLPTVALGTGALVFSWYIFVLPSRGLWRAGTYWVEIGTATNLPCRLGGENSGRQGSGIYGTVTATWDTFNEDFSASAYLLSDYDSSLNANIQGDQPVVVPVVSGTGTRSLVSASFDKTIIVWQLSHIPYVHRISAFTNNLYHATGVLASATTGEGFALDKWMLPGATLEIDCANRTATYTENGVPFPAKSSVAPVNPAEWLTYAAGANSLTWTEPDMLQTDVVLVHRGAKA